MSYRPFKIRVTLYESAARFISRAKRTVSVGPVAPRPGLQKIMLTCTCMLVLGCALSAFCATDKEAGPAEAPAAQQTKPGDAARTAPPVELNWEYVRGYWSDFANITTSPARWDASDWMTATLVVGSSAALYENDTKIRKWVQDHMTSTTSDLGDNVTLLGFGALTVPVVGGLYAYGVAAADGKAKETALLSVESFALTGVFVQVLKRTTGRHRPYTGDPYDTWGGPSLASTNDSFPSGHGSSAFSIATVIASEYDNYVVAPLAYTVAAITALNRIQRNAHWPSDTFVGSAIGYFTGKAIVAAHRGAEGRVALVPVFDEWGTGMALTYKY